MKTQSSIPNSEGRPPGSSPGSRRSFFKALAAGGGGAAFTGCAGSRGGVSVGSGDIGIMNFALVLESLEVEYYTRVLERPYAGMSRDERRVLEDIRNNETVHKEFFLAALGANAIRPIQYDFSTINFDSRTNVLMAALKFESNGVAAYNGSGSSIKDPNVLAVAGKIVSVEARHVGVLADLLYPNMDQFAPTALDSSDNPGTVLRASRRFIKTPLEVSGI